MDVAGPAPGGDPVPTRVGLIGPAPTLGRRRVLALALLAPAAAAGLGACTRGAAGPPAPDPLLALAQAARADAALVAAAAAADPELADRVDPLRAARTEHAAALEAEVVRAGGTVPTTPPAPPPTGAPSAAPTAAPAGVDGTVTLARVRAALAESQRGAAQLVPELPAERVGLVAAVAACCATYAAVLS